LIYGGPKLTRPKETKLAEFDANLKAVQSLYGLVLELIQKPFSNSEQKPIGSKISQTLQFNFKMEEFPA